MSYDKMYISNDEFLIDDEKNNILRSQNVGDISVGRKYDSNKLEYGLLPPLALEATVDVLTFGAGIKVCRALDGEVVGFRGA